MTSWVFGGERNFVKTILEAAKRRGDVDVVDDQVGRPTWHLDLSAAPAPTRTRGHDRYAGRRRGRGVGQLGGPGVGDTHSRGSDGGNACFERTWSSVSAAGTRSCGWPRIRTFSCYVRTARGRSCLSEIWSLVTGSTDRIATHARGQRGIRERYVAQLEGTNRRMAERFMVARGGARCSQRGISRRDYRLALTSARTAIARAPELSDSPMIGPRLNTLTRRHRAGALLGPRLASIAKGIGRSVRHVARRDPGRSACRCMEPV